MQMELKYPGPMRSIQASIAQFIKLESAGGIILFVMAILALVLENSPWHVLGKQFFATPLTISFGEIGLSKSLLLWINDGLMAVFFLLVGLEIKRELIEGELNSFDKMLLPLVAAVGGMLVPGLIYAYFNWHNPEALNGWAVPTATDIAFALGVLALLDSRVPTSVKIFLTALAILDDLGAILIIAIFYTEQLNYTALALACVCVVSLYALNRSKVTAFSPYGLIGLILWVCVLKSGIHATIGGVVLAFMIPIRSEKDPNHSPLRDLEKAIHPWVAFFIMPIFAFANAGISFAGVHLGFLYDPLPLGIALGLFFGKQVGVFGASWLTIKCGLARLPTGSQFAHIYGAALLCGIGFTMSLFIGGLAFEQNEYYYTALRVGVFIGSLVSGLVGYWVLLWVGRRKALHLQEALQS